MVSVLQVSRDCAKTLSRQRSHLSCATRTFKSYHPHQNATVSASSNATPAEKQAKRKTRKKFSELPKSFVNPDGSVAKPLPAWTGGLETPKELLMSASLQPSVLDESDQDIIDIGPLESTKPRKRRANRTAVQEDLSDSLEPSPGDGSIQNSPSKSTAKPKRKRATKPTGNEELPIEDDIRARQPKTQLATEIQDNLARFPHCILLTRVGQFYESYFDQAAEVARLLSIKLTTKSWGGQRVLMCGFPLMHLNKHLRILVQQNQRFVAICEEFMRDRISGPKGGFDRRVTRVVTPGTLIDEPFLNPYENNYLLSVSLDDTQSAKGEGKTKTNPVGLAWIDVSTGEFFTQNTTHEGLRDELVRIGPKEIVLSEELRDNPTHPIRQAIAEEGFFTSFVTSVDSVDKNFPHSTPDGQSRDNLTYEVEPLQSVKGLAMTDSEMLAVELLTAFMHAHLLEHMPRLMSPNRDVTETRMQIDAHTIKALEIRESMREGGTTGSLLSVVKKTITSSGTRLLARWLCSPSTSVEEITTRQSLVAFFKSRPHLRSDLVQSLGDIEDATRIVQKFLLGRGDAGDLLSICKTVNLWDSIKRRIELERKMECQERGELLADEWASLDILIERICDLNELAHGISSALTGSDGFPSAPAADEQVDEDDEPEISEPSIADTVPSLISGISGDWTIKPQYSEQLATLHASLVDLLSRREKLQQHLQAIYDAPSLTLRSSPGQGMHVHIGRSKRDQARIKDDPSFIPIFESGSTSSFFFQAWSQLGSQIVETTAAIYTAEREAFDTLRNEVNAHANDLRRNAFILDELDVTLAFANLAEEMNFVRPTVKDDTSYDVKNGRHPTVELGLLTTGKGFTPNTVTFSTDGPLHVITGPNMAGKSTLLRQTALIAILAQTGSFVPADSAEIGIVDKVFSRVGAKDDLFRDRSTFMVEMLETAEILQRATPKSLVIMDEVGRGTTVEDGIAIAFATIHHLLTMNRCRTLFATHFHELADMLGYSDNHRGQGFFSGVHFYCTDVDETEDGYFAYSHRLKPGVNRDSHGLKVAQLAGMPQSAVAVASTAMSWFKARRGETSNDTARLQSLGQRLASH